ncbi:MAG: hypothetical protein RBU21_14965 [FCB group bacterium]|nr:hypothetical protein [FCB group bacterium]
MRFAGRIALVLWLAVGTAGAQESPDDAAVVIESLDLDDVKAPQTGDGYDPRTTALLMNLCRESLCRIVDYNDRIVLDEEYSRLANNIDVTLIRDDEIAELIKRLMIELNALKLDEATKSQIVGYYERKMSSSILAALKPPKELLGKAATPVQMACQAILVTAWGTTNRAKALAKYDKEMTEKVLTLKADELKRLAELRTAFFGTEYTLWKRYGLQDRLNLKEVQMEQYIRVLQDDDPARRLARLERLKDDFEAYPPFWYQIGLAAQMANNPTLALAYYRRFDDVAAPVLREDPDRVAVSMHRIVLLNPEQDHEMILSDLKTIERNTKYYYRWENVLFAALTYYGLGDAENARRLIEVSINEGYNVPLHEEVLTEMESTAARAQLEGRRADMLNTADGIGFEKAMQMGRHNSIETLRALGNQITGITLNVAERSRAAQNAKLAVPGYNVYLIGREAFKGDVYFDNVVVRLPGAWYGDSSPKVSLRFNGKSIKSGDKSRDEKTGDRIVEFPRVMEQDGVLEKGRVYPCTLKLEDEHGELELGYEVRRVTEELLRVRPELPPDSPYFELKTVVYMGEQYRLEHGLIVPDK